MLLSVYVFADVLYPTIIIIIVIVIIFLFPSSIILCLEMFCLFSLSLSFCWGWGGYINAHGFLSFLYFLWDKISCKKKKLPMQMEFIIIINNNSIKIIIIIICMYAITCVYRKKMDYFSVCPFEYFPSVTAVHIFRCSCVCNVVILCGNNLPGLFLP